MKFTSIIISCALVGTSAQNLRQGRELEREQAHRKTGLLPDRFFDNFPSRGEGAEGNGFLDDIKDGIDDLLDDFNLTDHVDNFLDRFNVTDNLDDFFDHFNFTDGDTKPPCPPDGFLERFNITAEDLECDPDFDFSDIVGNFSDKIPCPPQNWLDRFNKTVDDLPCNPELEFPGRNFTGDNWPCPSDSILEFLNKTVDDFSCNPDLERPGWGGNFSIDDLADKIPCPPQEKLDRWNITQDDLWCNPDLEFPSFGRPNNNSTDEEDGGACGEEPVACARSGGFFGSGRDDRAAGVVVCQSIFGRESSRCVDPDRVRASDNCGCCGGECPPTCGCGCTDDDGETGVLMEGGFRNTRRCVSVEKAVSDQLNGFFNCVSDSDDQCA